MSIDLVFRRSDSEFVPECERDQFWSVYCDGYHVGSVMEHHGRSDGPPAWHWSIHLHAGVFGIGLGPTGGREPTRDEAMRAYRAAWEVIRPALTDEGWELHVERMEKLAAQKERQRGQPGTYHAAPVGRSG